MFPLFEIENGTRYTVTHKSQGVPVDEYLKLQGRFRYLDAKNQEVIQAEANRFYNLLLSLQKSEQGSQPVTEAP